MSFCFVMKGITVNVAWLIWHKLRPNIQLNSSKLSRTPLASPLNKMSFWSKPWMRKICMTGCTQSTHFWREKSGMYEFLFTEILRIAIKTHFQYFYSIAKVLHFLFYLFSGLPLQEIVRKKFLTMQLHMLVKDPLLHLLIQCPLWLWPHQKTEPVSPLGNYY